MRCGIGNCAASATSTRELVSGAAAINATAEGTSVLGTWEPRQVTDVVLTLMASGFELAAVRRLEVA